MICQKYICIIKQQMFYCTQCFVFSILLIKFWESVYRHLPSYRKSSFAERILPKQYRRLQSVYVCLLSAINDSKTPKLRKCSALSNLPHRWLHFLPSLSNAFKDMWSIKWKENPIQMWKLKHSTFYEFNTSEWNPLPKTFYSWDGILRGADNNQAICWTDCGPDS